MAHIKKYTSSATGALCSHYDRSKNPPTENIDNSRTGLNYNLASDEQPRGQIDFIHQRLSEVKVHKRKDLNVMCDWVVTVPKDLPQNFHKAFFQETYNFLKNKYGKENIISSWVHEDEVTPHMHFAFIPVVEDKRKGGYKVSAKECITRADLKTFHENLQEYLEERLKMPVNVLNGATKEGNKSIADLKRGTAQKVIEGLKTDIENLQKEIVLKQNELNISGSQISNIKAMGLVMARHTELYSEYRAIYEKLEKERNKLAKKIKRNDISL